VGAAHSAPAAGDGEEDVGEVGDEELLLLGGEHEIAVALGLRGEGGEDSTVDAKVGVAHVGAFFGAGKSESDSAKVVGGHVRLAKQLSREQEIRKGDLKAKDKTKI